MIDLAIKHESKLKELFANIVFDKKYMFYTSESYYDAYESTKTTWMKHEFVSLDSNGNVIGYIKYNIDRDTLNAHSLQIINFSDNIATFGIDTMKCLEDIFVKFQFNKLSYCVVVGNSIEKTYDRLTAKYGGVIVGTKRRHCKQMDGNFYDMKMYEILRDDFINSLSNK